MDPRLARWIRQQQQEGIPITTQSMAAQERRMAVEDQVRANRAYQAQAQAANAAQRLRLARSQREPYGRTHPDPTLYAQPADQSQVPLGQELYDLSRGLLGSAAGPGERFDPLNPAAETLYSNQRQPAAGGLVYTPETALPAFVPPSEMRLRVGANRYDQARANQAAELERDWQTQTMPNPYFSGPGGLNPLLLGDIHPGALPPAWARFGNLGFNRYDAFAPQSPPWY